MVRESPQKNPRLRGFFDASFYFAFAEFNIYSREPLS